MTMKKLTNMAPRYNRVVLCRSSTDNNDSQETYVKTFKTAGYLCDTLPTLCFEFVNISTLKTCLLSSTSYYGNNRTHEVTSLRLLLSLLSSTLIGLIMTSRRAVEAVGLASKGENVLNPWRTLPVYCVGPATESFAKRQLSSENCFGKETGNAKELAEVLVSSVAKESKPLLYPCSEIGRETIEKILRENDIKVHRIVVYKTLPSKTLEIDLSVFMDNLPKIFVFFSPSTVEHIVKLLKQKLYDLSYVKAVAIGPVTKQALIDCGLEVFATANKPDPTSLLEAIRDAEISNIAKTD